LVQEELTFAIQLLFRQGTFLPSYAKVDNAQTIPFMALDGLGKRHVLAEGQSELSGKFIVEQVEVDGQQLRRLYFLNNPFLIQTEVVMKELETGVYVVDPSHAAFDYHKAGTCCLNDRFLLIPVVIGALTMFYHDAVIAGLFALMDSPEHCMLIGLGGGGLLNFLHHVAPACRVTAIELDPAVAQIAERYFGLDNPSLKDLLTIKICDGLLIDVAGSTTDEQTTMQPESLSFIVIDVDTKDTTVGMSCPPVSFVDTAYLRRLQFLLVPSGVLAINVSARDPSLLECVCSNVGEIFPNVYISNQNNHDDINVVLLATKSERSPLVGSSFVLSDETISDELRLLAQNLSRWGVGAQGTGKSESRKKKAKRGKGKVGKCR
jgi:hypothetical protein